LVKKQFQELAATRRKMEELQAAWVVKAQRVWDFLLQTETMLAPLGFSSLRSRDPVWEASTVLPLLDSMVANMLLLEEVIGE
jgi:hypothetical protein